MRDVLVELGRILGCLVPDSTQGAVLRDGDHTASAANELLAAGTVVPGALLEDGVSALWEGRQVRCPENVSVHVRDENGRALDDVLEILSDDVCECRETIHVLRYFRC